MTDNSRTKRRTKRPVFWLILMFVPFVILGTLEILLPIFNYEAKDKLVKEDWVNGRLVYALNPNVTDRYFSRADFRPVPLSTEYFPRDKPSDTYRILCLGSLDGLWISLSAKLNFLSFSRRPSRDFNPFKDY